MQQRYIVFVLVASFLLLLAIDEMNYAEGSKKLFGKILKRKVLKSLKKKKFLPIPIPIPMKG